MNKNSIPKVRGKMFMWWNIEPNDLLVQVNGYNHLALWKSARKLSGILLFSCAIFSTILGLLISSRESIATAILSIIVYTILGFFCYRGSNSDRLLK